MASNRLPSFVTGLGVGAILGFLLAPKRGDETREALRETAEVLCDRGREVVETQRDTWESALEAGVSAYRQAAGDLE